MAPAPGWYRYDGDARRLTLTLHVQPNARSGALAGLHGDALKVRIAAPATDNRANTALVRLIADTLGVAVSAVAIRRGSTGRRKVVVVAPIDEPAARRILARVNG